jgi:hypothetical protein
MALLDDLRDAAGQLDGQFQPAANELQAMVGALIQFVEHGQAFLQAAREGVDEVTELVAELPPGDDADPEGTPEQRDKAASKASKAATGKRTRAEHETGGGD